jgi:hypothetical protein
MTIRGCYVPHEYCLISFLRVGLNLIDSTTRSIVDQALAHLSLIFFPLYALFLTLLVEQFLYGHRAGVSLRVYLDPLVLTVRARTLYIFSNIQK